MLTTHRYINVDNTLKKIREWILLGKLDSRMRVFDSYSLQQIFDYMAKRVKYVDDPVEVATQGYDDVELLKLPYLTDLNGGDCDDKSIFLGAIFERKKIPYRMKVVTVDPSKDYHHIYPEIFYKGAWRPFDATYPYNTIFTERLFVKAKIYDWRSGEIKTFEYTPQFQMLAGNQKSNSVVNANGVLLSDFLLPYEILRLRSGLSGLGFDPATIAAVAMTIFGLFTGANKPPDNITMLQQIMGEIAKVQNAYGGGEAANTKPEAMQQITSLYALKGPLFKAYGLIPPGKAIHEVWPSVPWDSISSDIGNKAQAFAPFLYMVWADPAIGANQPGNPASGKLTWWADDIILALYNDTLTNAPRYQMYQAAIQKGQTKAGMNLAGMGSLPILLLIGAGIYLIATKKKGRR